MSEVLRRAPATIGNAHLTAVRTLGDLERELRAQQTLFADVPVQTKGRGRRGRAA